MTHPYAPPQLQMLQQPIPTPMQEQLPSSSFSLTATPICQILSRFQPATWKGKGTRSIAAPQNSRKEAEMRRVNCSCCHALRGLEWATTYSESPWPAGTIASQAAVLGCGRQKEKFSVLRENCSSSPTGKCKRPDASVVKKASYSPVM